MRAKSCVQVSVLDYRRKPLPYARVTLESLEQGYDTAIELEYDARHRLYQAVGVRPGRYVVRAEAKGFEPQDRELHVDPAGSEETFILGKEGMPFYYRGKARVPFEPPEDLLGVSVRPGLSDRQEEELLAFASEVKLEPVKVGEPVREDNVRVFRFPADINEQSKQEVQQHLSRHPLVRLVGPVVHMDEKRVTFLTNQLVAKFKPHVTKEEIPAIADRHNLEIVRTIPYAGNAYLLCTDREADYGLLDVCDALVKSGLVEYAEPNLVTTMADAQINPTDSLYNQQWHIPLINLPEAWDVLQNENAPGVAQGDPGDLTFGSENVIIAILDRGIQSQTVGGVTSAAHPDFEGTVTSGNDKVTRFFDFARMVPNNDAPPNDHGMGCAGVATALANNPSVVAGEEEGVVGAAPNCQVMGLIRPYGLGELRYSDAYIWIAGFHPGWVADGTDYPVGTVFPATPHPGADIISNSFGWDAWPISGLMSDTIDFLTTYGRSGKGVLLFFAATNNNSEFSLDQGLARHPKTMAVAASSLDDDGVTEIRAAYSSFGDGIDFCAPSHDAYVGGGALHNPPANYGIISCDLPGGGNLAGHTGGALDYRNNFGGTSSSTPLVAGVAALVLSLDPGLTWIEVRQILRDTAQEIDPNNTDPDGRWQDVLGNVATDPGYLGPHYSEWYGYGRIDAEAAVIAARDYAHDRDIVVRENLADTGSVPSAGVFYNSPDIWVRNRAPAVDGAAALPASYLDDPPHQDPISEQDNWIYVRFKNIGTAPSYDFYLRVYLTHFAGTEFVYPNNYIPTNRPGDPIPTPLEPATYLIGEVHCPSLDGEDSDILNLRWPEELVPPETVMVSGVPVAWHPCLLVEVSPHDSPVALPLLEALIHVWDSNDLAQKNISVIYSHADAFAMAGVLGNLANRSPYLELLVDLRRVPPQVELFVELLDPKAKEWLRTFVQEHKLKLGSYKGREVVWLAPREQTRIPVFAGGDKLVPMLLGAVVRQEVKPDEYEIGLTQLDPNGKPSGGLAIRLRVGE